MLTSQDFAVSPEDKRNLIFPRLRKMLADYSSQERPHVAFVGGQPASGKSKFINRTAEDLGGAFSVDSDELRKLHPQLEEIVQLDPLRMDILTNEPIGYWFKTCVEQARERRVNVIIENTFTQSGVLIAEAKDFMEHGYSVSFGVLATSEQVSRLGIVNRYREAVANNKIPRWTAHDSHDRAYGKIPSVLAEILQSRVVDSLTITTRDHTNPQQVTDPKDIAPTLDRLRKESFTPEHHAQWVDMYQNCMSFMLDSHLVTSHSAPLLAQLHQDAENLLPSQQLPDVHTRLAEALSVLSIQDAQLQNQALGAVWDDELTKKVTQMMDTSLIAHDRPITEVLAHDQAKKNQQNIRPAHHRQTSQEQAPDHEH